MDEPPQADLDRRGKRMLEWTLGPLTRAKRANRVKEGYSVMGTLREEEEGEDEEGQKEPKTAAELTEILKELTVKVENEIGPAKSKRAILGVRPTEERLTEDGPANIETAETQEERGASNTDSNSEDSRTSSEDSENDDKDLIKVQKQFTSKAVRLLKTFKDNQERHGSQMKELERENEELIAKLREYRDEKEILQDQVIGLKNLGDQKGSKIKDLQEKIRTANEQKAKAIEELQGRIRSLNMNRQSDLDLIEVRLGQELKQRNDKQEAIERQTMELEEEILKLREGQRACQERINKLTESNIAMSNKERKRKDRMDRMKKEIESNNNSLTSVLNHTVEPIEEEEINIIIDGMNERSWEEELTQVEAKDDMEEQKKQRIEYMRSGGYKRLESMKWPKAADFTTYAEFIQITKNLADKLINRGHPEDLIAEALDNSLNASRNTSKYMTISLEHDTSTLNGVIEALEACDIVYTRTTCEERFNGTKKHPREDWEEYIARCSNLYDKMENGDPNHGKARIRRIKEQFFKGANIQRSYADKFMGMNDLDAIVARVIKDEEEGGITYEECGGTEKEAYAEFRQGNVHPAGCVFSERTGRERPKGWKPRDTSPDERPKGWERDGMIWMPIYTVEGQEEAEVNNEEKKPLYRMKRAPPGTKRVPNDIEYEGLTDFCRRCRQKDHIAEDCTWRRYCGYCKGEVGHTNGMHIQGKSRSQTGDNR